MQQYNKSQENSDETPSRESLIEAIRQHGVSEKSSYLIRAWKRMHEANIRNITDEDEADRATTLLHVEEALIFLAGGAESAEDATTSLLATKNHLAVGDHQKAIAKGIDLCLEKIETGSTDIEQLMQCFNANTTLQ